MYICFHYEKKQNNRVILLLLRKQQRKKNIYIRTYKMNIEITGSQKIHFLFFHFLIFRYNIRFRDAQAKAVSDSSISEQNRFDWSAWAPRNIQLLFSYSLVIVGLYQANETFLMIQQQPERQPSKFKPLFKSRKN